MAWHGTDTRDLRCVLILRLCPQPQSGLVWVSRIRFDSVGTEKDTISFLFFLLRVNKSYSTAWGVYVVGPAILWRCMHTRCGLDDMMGRSGICSCSYMAVVC
jgi:hypothetical protein